MVAHCDKPTKSYHQIQAIPFRAMECFNIFQLIVSVSAAIEAKKLTVHKLLATTVHSTTVTRIHYILTLKTKKLKCKLFLHRKIKLETPNLITPETLNLHFYCYCIHDCVILDLVIQRKSPAVSISQSENWRLECLSPAIAVVLVMADEPVHLHGQIACIPFVVIPVHCWVFNYTDL